MNLKNYQRELNRVLMTGRVKVILTTIFLTVIFVLVFALVAVDCNKTQGKPVDLTGVITGSYVIVGRTSATSYLFIKCSNNDEIFTSVPYEIINAKGVKARLQLGRSYVFGRKTYTVLSVEPAPRIL